jgi:hypothetical protein
VLTLPAGVEVTTAWEADYRQDGGKLTLTPKSWNSGLGPGDVIAVGFQASGAGQPLTCNVNAVTCVS